MKFHSEDILKYRALLENLLVEDESKEASLKIEKGLLEMLESLPNINIDEHGWGSDSPGRDEFISYFGSLINTEQHPIGKIESIITELEKIKTLNPAENFEKIFQQLIFLRTLYRIITSFSASGAGFIFEALVAVITGGTQVTTTGDDGHLTITDVEVAGESYSIKLLSRPKSGNVVIKGSISNLMKVTKAGKNVTYILIERLENGAILRFSYFIITPDNVDLFVYGMSQSSAKPGQFAVNYGKIDNTYSNTPLGEINISKENIQEIVKSISVQLKTKLVPIYKNLNDFTKNLYKYFTASDKSVSKSTLAADTKKSSTILDSTVQTNIQK